MVEQCIAWEPVPPEANRHMVLNVVYVEQMALGLSGTPLSVIVASSSRQGEPGTISVDAWRITFRNVVAFRSMELAMWRGVRPKETPIAPLTIATWEIANSQWLSATVSAQYLAQLQPRHWVIASSYDIYEFAARYWKSEHLADWKGMRVALRERWVRDHGEMPRHGL